MRESRWILLLAAACGPLGMPPLGRAETPEPMPHYADARALREDASLRAVAFGIDTTGIACGDRGAILRSEDGGQTWQPQESGLDCSLDDVIWIGPQRVVVVGGSYDRITRISRGVVLYSDDAGKHWQRAVDEELPRLKTVRAAENNSLVAVGDWSHSLLTREFESHDGGRTWHASGEFETNATLPQPPTSAELSQWAGATGVSVPIRDACRFNDSALCAVGDHGVILLSDDAGKSWTVKRGQNRHSAILLVANEPGSVAWSLLGSEVLETRNRVSLLVHQTPEQPNTEASPIEIANRVAVMLGGSGADPITSHGGDLMQEANQWIAIHRPSALVLDKSLPAEVRDAFFQAATSSGVLRVVTYALDGENGTALHRNALLPKAGVLASDLVFDAMHYVAPHRSNTSSISLHYLYDVAPATRRGDTVVGGLPLDEGQVIAAPYHRASRRQLQMVQARLNQSERVSKLIRSSRTSDQFSESLAQTLDQTAKGDRFRLAWSILQQTNTTNTSSSDNAFHVAALDEFASRFPATSAGRWAKLRRHVIRHSLELQRLRSSLAETTTTPVVGTAAEIVAVSPFQVSPNGVRQASAVSPILVPKPESLNPRNQKAEARVEVDLAWEFHPLMLISQEAARRRGDDGGLQVAGGQSANLRRLAEARSGPWSWLLQTAGPHVVIARETDSRPKLDGIIDDPCWQSALASAGRSQRLRLAYDNDFVYVAIQCHSSQLDPDVLAGQNASSVRDQDLSQVDRMQLRIDTDRDLVTAMHLQVTDAGRTHDSIDSNPDWHPTWYVDTRRSDDQVTIEMAILRRDLVDLPIHEDESWFVSATPLRAGSVSHETVVPKPSEWMRVIFQR